jgi:hypothetical protein
MTSAALFSQASLALFSQADLRYRVAPGAALFFFGAVLFAAPGDPLQVSQVVLAVGWGLRGWPSILIIPALFCPSTWAVLMAGAGLRRRMVGRADMLVLAGVACLFGWPATVFAFVGVETWRWYWGNQKSSTVPALPGMLIGFSVYLLWMSLSG